MSTKHLTPHDIYTVEVTASSHTWTNHFGHSYYIFFTASAPLRGWRQGSYAEVRQYVHSIATKILNRHSLEYRRYWTKAIAANKKVYESAHS